MDIMSMGILHVQLSNNQVLLHIDLPNEGKVGQ